MSIPGRTSGGVGRADLLRALRPAAAAGETQHLADLLGYEGILRVPEQGQEAPPEMVEHEASPVLPPAPPPPCGADERSVRFLQQAGAWERQERVAEAARVREPITLDELRAPVGRHAPRSPLLQPWRRLGPYLRRVLGQAVEGRQLHARRAIEVIARLRPVHRLPRHRWNAWASQATLVMDASPVLAPFRPDAEALVARLASERGRAGLTVTWTRGLPPKTVDGRTAGGPVLVVGDLGRLSGHEDVTREWVNFGKRLRRCGQRVAALLPCPRERWSSEQAGIFASAAWDCGESLPRTLSGVRARPSLEEEGRRRQAADQLLALASAAVRIEPGMLRTLRCLLSPGLADVGTEYDVWHHRDLARNEFAASFLPNASAEHWRQFTALPAELIRRVADVILAWHELFSAHYQRELRERLSRAGILVEAGLLAKARSDAWRIADTLAEAVRSGDRSLVDAAGLRRLTTLRLGRLTPEERGGRGLERAFVATALLEARPAGEVPPGLNPVLIEAEANALLTVPPTAQRWELHQRGEEIVWRPADEATVTPGNAVAVRARRHRFEVRLELASGYRVLELLPPSGEAWRSSLADVRRLEIRSDIAGVELLREPRPSWASRMGRDRFGLYADLELAEGVPLRLRWIPPGRFLMGSPEDEAGRFDNEGPRHEVTISSGFWLGETPVTQRQWEAMMGDIPSHFSGKEDSAERPVESVDWHRARAFCAAVAERFPELAFDLPAEAEWEYACRAGTESAFHSGFPCTETEGTDPAVEMHGWYRRNSEFRTHPVKLKKPNAWGLFDIHGNVFEWCLDAMRRYESNSCIDPFGPLADNRRIVRGGSWARNPRDCRSALRDTDQLALTNPNLGFRLAAGQELPPSQQEDGARGRAEKAERDAEPRRSPVRGVRRPRPWAQRFERDVFGVRLEFSVREARFVWRWIPHGSFLMGSAADEPGRWDDESPQHKVTISRGFWLGATPVTQAQWEAVMRRNPAHFKGADRPVESVSWEECAEYATALNGLLPGLGARLPTEAEWEYACRAGTTAAFNNGQACTAPVSADPALEPLGWYDKNSGEETHPVGLKQANARGLFDLHGNVLEWCQDWWANRYDAEQKVDPTGPKTGVLRVFRGGCYFLSARYCRSAYRFGYRPGNRSHDLGFRLAAGQELAPEAQGAGARGLAAEAGRDDPPKGQTGRGGGSGGKKGKTPR